MFDGLFKKTEATRLKELERKVGFGLAVVIMLDELPREFFSTVSDKNWYSVRSNCNTSEQKSKVVEILLNQNKTFDQWSSLYRASDNNDYWRYPGTIENAAVKKAVELASTFNQWYAIHSYGIYELQIYALKKMEKLASTFNQWQIIYQSANHCFEHETKNNALEMMKKYR